MPTPFDPVAAAALAGQHAWPAFLPALLALMALAYTATAAARGLLRRWRGPSPTDAGQPEPDPEPGRLLAGLLLGFGLLVGLACLLAMAFAEIAEGLAAGHPMGRMDDALSRAIGQATPAAVREGFAFYTRISDPLPMVVLCAVVAALLWRARHRAYAIGWVAAVAGNALLNHALKQIFERVRPDHEGGPISATGFSFPSGHSSGAVAAYGMLAYLGCCLLPARWHPPVVAAATGMALGTATSRVFLQVHYPSDVAAGICSGLAWLAVCIASVHFARQTGRWRMARQARADARSGTPAP